MRFSERKKRKTLNYHFTDKHIDYIRRTKGCAYNIAEGSIRSGKTTDNVLAFSQDIKEARDKIFLATASTQPTAKLIIGDCDGFGLEHIFRGQCRWGKYKGNECLIIKGPATRGREKIVLFCGGAKADSYKKFRGFTIGAWIATEINLHHENTIQEGLKRQIKADRKKLYWDLNPDNPGQQIYTEYIDKWATLASEGKLRGGFNYQAFNIFDNINIPKKNLDEILSRYEEGTVWYIRDILGKRCAAEGLIYRQFANDSSKWIIDKVSDEDRKEIAYISIGIDYGGNRSLTAFSAVAILRGYKKVIALADHHIAGQKGEIDSDRVNAEFVSFVKRLKEKYPNVDIRYGFGDNEAQYLNNGLRKACRAAGLNITIRDCVKTDVSQRIICTNTLLNTGRLLICKDCSLLIGGLKNAVWDSTAKVDTRLDNFSSDIDILDAFEYAWCAEIARLIPQYDMSVKEAPKYNFEVEKPKANGVLGKVKVY